MNLRRKLLAFLQNQKKRVEYTELEWIGNEENCYIFFPLVTAGKDIVELEYEAQFTRTDVQQAEGKNGDPYFFIGLMPNSVWYAGCGYYGNSTVKADTEWHNFRLVSYGDDNGFWLDGTRIYKSDQRDSAYLPQGFRLWIGQNGSRTTYNRKKYVKVKVNGKLVYDLIPVLDKDFVPCMYDKLTGNYFYNDGDGEFTWKLPNQLEYLELTGKQWIDTGFVPLRGDEIRVTNVQCTKGSDFRTVFSAGVSTHQLILLVNNTSGTTGVDAYLKYFGSGGASNVTTNLNNPTDIKLDSNGDLYYNDVLVASNTPQGDVDTNLCLFKGANDTSFMIGKVGIFTVKRDDKFIRYLVPAFDEDLTVCMYDLVEKKYHYNDGTDKFKGFFEDGSQLLSYLSSSGTQYIETELTVTPTIGFYGEGEASLTDASFETLAGYDTYFLPLAIVPSSKKICMGYGDNTNAPTLYPLLDGRLMPSSQTSGISSDLFIKYSGRFKVSLNFKGSNLWKFEDENIKYEIGLPIVSPEDNEHTMTVFGRKYDDNVTNRFMWRGPIYKAIFTDGEQVIMNLVPVLKSDNTACMFDLVSKKYFVNAGSGSFDYGG